MLVKFSGLDAAEVKKLEAAMKDESFVDSLAGKETAEEVREALSEKGINFSLEEVEQIKATLAQAEKEGNELSENDLEAVAGGGGTFTLVDIEWTTKKGTKITVHIPW